MSVKSKSHFACLFVLAALGLAAGSAYSQSYPNKPIRLILSFPPGGGTDLLGRTVSQRLAERWGQPVVVDNRPGANGIIGARAAMTADPDGYTLYVGSSDHMILVPNLFDNLPYDTVKDFQPVISLANQYYILVVHPSVPANSVKEFIALAKAKPGQLNFSSPGTGTGGHLTGELFQSLTATKLTHVPYKGSAPAIADLLGGRDVQLSFASMASVVPHIKAGKLRALTITTEKRLAAVPDVATTAETGFPTLVIHSWNGVFAPVGTRPELVARVNNEINAILRTPEVIQLLTSLGLDPTGGTPAQFAENVKADLQRWAKIIKDAGIKKAQL
jgi:tripartite-type tricarboxylate transporter receptor subunit TctC